MNTEILKRKKILYLTVPFFEYTHFIEMEMKSLGAEVDTVVLYNKSFINRSLIRLHKKLLDLKHDRYLSKAISAIIRNHKSYNYVFIQYPHLLGVKYLEILKSHYNRSVFIHYAWDPEYIDSYSKFYNFFDKNFTFDRNDAMHFNHIYHPLFYTHHFENGYRLRNKNNAKYDAAFIGKVSFYEERYEWINEMIAYFRKNNLSFYLFLLTTHKKYFKSFLKGNKWKNVFFQPLSLNKIAEIYSMTNVVIDQKKPHQYGLTMRTFEVLGTGSKLVTSNRSIANEPFYSAESILITDYDTNNIPIEFFRSKSVRNELLTRYRIDNWLLSIFNKANSTYGL
jgi:hypothetical protein